MWCCLGYIAGIALANSLIVPGALEKLILITSFMGLVFAFCCRNLVAICIIAFSGAALGYLRSLPIQDSVKGYEVYIGKEIVVRGVVNEDVSYGSRGEQNIQLKQVEIDGASLPGRVWVQVVSKQKIQRSDILIVYGKSSEGFGVMPLAMYKAVVVDVYSEAYSDVGRTIRDWFASKIRITIPEPEASLGIGYLVGQRSLLPQDINDAMRVLGLTHVVVASGYNLTILVRFTRRIFAKKSKYLAFAAATIMVISFVMMTGASPSMSRAALVTGLSLLAWYFGRNIQPMVLLGIVGAITALINPFYVWGDLGWYLSMLSFVGIMIVAPLIKAYFFDSKREPSWLTSIVIETLSAQIATFPLIAYVFGQYSLLSLPANVLVVPLVPVAMATTFIAGMAVVVLPFTSSFIYYPASIILEYMITVVRYMATLPYASSEVGFGLGMMIISYVIMVLVLVYMWKITKYNFGNDNIIK